MLLVNLIFQVVPKCFIILTRYIRESLHLLLHCQNRNQNDESSVMMISIKLLRKYYNNNLIKFGIDANFTNIYPKGYWSADKKSAKTTNIFIYMFCQRILYHDENQAGCNRILIILSVTLFVCLLTAVMLFNLDFDCLSGLFVLLVG